MLIFDVWGLCMKIKFWLVLFLVCLLSFAAKAQYAAQNDAMYLATLKSVINYKIDDEENLKNVEALRSNQYFLQDLSKMMAKLSNRRTKNSVNSKVYKILINAGKDIYKELN